MILSKRGKRRRRLSERLAESLDFPEGMTGGLPDILITDDREIAVSECRSVLQYDNDRVKLQLRNRTIDVYGKAFTLKTFYNNRLMIKGYITKIEFGE